MQIIRVISLCALSTLLAISNVHAQAGVLIRTLEILGESSAARYAAEKVFGMAAAKMTTREVGAAILDNPRVAELFLGRFSTNTAAKLGGAIDDAKIAHYRTITSLEHAEKLFPPVAERSVTVGLDKFTFDPPLGNFKLGQRKILFKEMPNPAIPVAAFACAQYDCDKVFSARIRALMSATK